ncbi:MAG: discoidin domain-containing protein [Chloroflexota bacterium]
MATASEIYSASYPASAAIDGNTTTDWAEIGYAPGDWWRATLGQPITLDRVRLYPRDGSCETFGFGRVRFSDGTAVPFDLRGTTNSSNPLTLDFAAKERIAWVEVVTDGGGSTCNSGLAEVAAFDTSVSTSANLLRPSGLASYSSSTAHGNQPTPLAADGNTQTDWAVAARAVGAWWRVDWSTPQTLDRIQLYPRDNASDNFGIGTIHFSDSSTVAFNLTSYTNSSVPLTLDFTRRSGITWMKVVTDNGGGNS